MDHELCYVNSYLLGFEVHHVKLLNTLSNPHLAGTAATFFVQHEGYLQY